MIDFFRTNYSTLWLNIVSNEQLGILDTGYIEDYNGVDGHITLFHLATDTAYDVVMSAVPAETPAIAHDYFRGGINLAGLPDGAYQIRGRVRDVVGNYTIVGAFASPNGLERVLNLQIRILSGTSIRFTVDAGPLMARGGYDVDVSRSSRTVNCERLNEAIDVARKQIMLI